MAQAVATGQAVAVGPATGDVIRYSPRVVAEVGIGCERCHGPGERHVAAATRSQPLRDTICNPAHLTADRADDVCNQCHLSGAAQGFRYGRRDGDFRPGDRLSDVWLTFGDGEQSARASAGSAALAVSHVWQTWASRCYQASGGELRCVSCHDPHGVPDAEARVAFFNNKCLECHTVESCGVPRSKRETPPSHGSCIACHMPRSPAADVPHTTQTDHRIARRPTVGEGVAAGAVEQTGDGVIKSDFSGVPAWEVQRARALLAAQRAEQERSPTLAGQVLEQLRPFESMVDGDADLLDARAICRLLVGQRAEAIRDWERLQAIDPRRLSALQSLLSVHMDAGESTRAAGYAERLLALNPRQAEVLWRYSILFERLGRFEQASEAIEKAWRLNPASAAIRDRRAKLRSWAVPSPRTSSRSSALEESEREESARGVSEKSE